MNHCGLGALSSSNRTGNISGLSIEHEHRKTIPVGHGSGRALFRLNHERVALSGRRKSNPLQNLTSPFYLRLDFC